MGCSVGRVGLEPYRQIRRKPAQPPLALAEAFTTSMAGSSKFGFIDAGAVGELVADSDAAWKFLARTPTSR